MVELKKLIEFRKLVKKMSNDKRFTDVDVNGGGISFHVVDVNDYFDEYEGYDVIWNDCEDCEGEGQVNYSDDIELDDNECELIS